MEIFLSSIVKIRRALVQLKQFKKIKHLQECNFPHFTSESKYQMKAHIWKYEMLHNIPVCTAFILSDPSPIIELPCYVGRSCRVIHWAHPLVEFCANCWICQSGFDKLINRFLQVIVWIDYMDLLICYGVAKWICFDCCMDLSKLLFVFLALCQTKPSWWSTKISKLIEASALN